MDILDLKTLKAWGRGIYEGHSAAVAEMIRMEIIKIEMETKKFEEERGQ